MEARVSHLWRHPIKGHGFEPLERSVLAAGSTMPGDRIWAIGHEAARIDPSVGDWAPCANFSRGAKSPQLMAIRARLDEATGKVTLEHPQRPALTVYPDDAEDAVRLVEWVQPISDPDRARPTFVTRARRRGMTDSDFPSIAILNRSSLAALSQRIGRPLAMEDRARHPDRRCGPARSGADHPVQGDQCRSRDGAGRCGHAGCAAVRMGTPGLRGLCGGDHGGRHRRR
ncbi:MAG: MOSC N-terminal beta barrel domain-containing protein [Burkholderiales bacterium]|nr:MOSC N-terminal beta barrel domain-containing protein [Burkholderiales bacterium]